MAEVLITLAIIGVVAALTIPTVVTNYRKSQAATQLKKVYSQLNQAIQMSSIEYGNPMTWEIKGDPANQKPFYEKYIKLYIKVIKEYPLMTSFAGKYKWLNGNNITEGYIAANNYAIVTADGTMIEFETTSNTVLFHIDLNGVDNPPNTAGKDYFMFQLYISDGKLKTHGNPTKIEADNNCKKTTSSGVYGAFCTAKVMYDGWQIKYDW